jgi:GNAT superfamily N-acetyltransferase
MADYIRPTPRNPILGLLADAMMGGLAYMEDPRRTQQMRGLGGLLSETGIAQTMERLSYGEPLTTGRGMTTRLRPEAEAALMTLGPEAVPIGRAATAAVRATKGLPVGAGIRDAGKKINVNLNDAGNYLSAKSEYGQVGGVIKPPDALSDKPYLRINYAEVEESQRGKGLGKSLYEALINDATNRGLRVFSDSTVEKPAVNVYKSLGKGGYDLKDMSAGVLDDETMYGAGANLPVFEIKPRTGLLGR